MRTLFLTPCCLLLLTATAVAELEVEKSKDETAGDTPLTFELQRAGDGGYGGFQVWGKVVNATDKTFENVQVIITIYDAKGGFLGRGRASANPGKIGPGQVSYIDELSVNIEKRKPARLEWKVVRESFDF